MGVQFEWQAGTGDGQWETLAKTQRRSPLRMLRRVRWWVWCIVGVVLFGAALGGYILVRRRYDAVTRQVAFDIQNVIDIEAQAVARHDIELFLDQQDSTAVEWFQQQESRVRFECTWSAMALAAMYQRCAPLLPARVERVELRQDVAWVQVLEMDGMVRRARFYRQTDRGWKQTAPEVAFWQVPVELRYDDLIFRYHRRDEPYVMPLIERIYDTIHVVCKTADCPPLSGSSADTLVVVFSVDVPFGQQPQLDGSVLLLASPWLTGLPVDGTWDDAYLRELAYRVERALGDRALGVQTDDARHSRLVVTGFVGTYQLDGSVRMSTDEHSIVIHLDRTQRATPLSTRAVDSLRPRRTNLSVGTSTDRLSTQERFRVEQVH